MTVDFVLKKAPSYRIANVRWTGPWSDREIRKRFESVETWAKAHGLRTGRWIFREPADRVWDAGIEVRGAARSEGRVKVQTLPATMVASVRFDPDVVSPRVVYHGVTDWLRSLRREKEIRSAGAYRELYDGNPWREKRSWANTEIQVVVRR